MALLRFNLDLAIPLDVEGKLPPALYKKLNEIYTPTQLQAVANLEVVEVIKILVRKLKEFAVKINEGAENEEASVKAVYHICIHDEDPSGGCPSEEEI